MRRYGRATDASPCDRLEASRGRRAARLAWSTCKLGLGLALLALIGGGFFIGRIALGPLSIKGLGPQIAQALDERFGGSYEFSLADTAIVKNGYAPALTIDKFSVKERSGHTVLTAPRAEVSVDPLALILGHVTPRRLEIFDVEVHLALRPDGSIALPISSSSGDAVALTPPLASALAGVSNAPPPAAATPNFAPSPLAKPRALLVKEMAASIRLVIDTLTNPESPAAAIDRIGITRGKIVVDDETAGQTLVFNGVNLAFDKLSGATRFNLSVEGPNGRWTASGIAQGTPGSERGLKLSFANLSLDEILLATGSRSIGADFDMPLSGKFSVRLQGDGMLSEAAGQLEFGAGYLRFDNPNDEPLLVDRLNGGFHWNSATRRIVIDRWRLVAGATHFAFSGSVTPPIHEGDPWSIALINAERGVSGPERPGEKPVLIDHLGLAARLFLAEKRLILDRFSFSGPECGLAMAGGIDWINGPHIRLGASISPTPVGAVLRLWPSFLAPPIKSYLLPRARGGMVEKGTMQIDFDAADLRAMFADHPPRDEKSAVDFTITNASLEFLRGVPPLHSINGVGHITGRTATFNVANAAVDAGDGRILSLSEGTFRIPDTGLKPAPATIEGKITSSVEAIGALLSYEGLKPYASIPLDPATLHGQADGTLEIDLKLGPDINPADTMLKINAAITNFTAERLIGSEKLDAATLNVAVDPSGLRTSGQGMMFGTPVTIAMEKPADKPAEASIALTLDDATRARLGLAIIPGLEGPIGAKIAAPIGTGDKPKARIELDLTHTSVEISGISKPAGRPGKVTFALAVNDTGTSVDQIIVDAGTIQARGSADLGTDFSLIAARFPQVKLSPGDDMKIDATRAGETMKVIVQGTTIDARPFLKALIFSPPEHTTAANGDEHKDAGPGREIEFDVKSGILTGYNKGIITGVELRYAKRDDQLQQFSFSGTFGDQPISCNLTGGGGAAPRVNLVTEDGGSLLSFLDLYKHMERGRLVVGLRLGNDTLSGVLVIDDFVLRDEPALRRLVVEAAPPLETQGRGQKINASAIAFNKLQVRFHRDGSRLDLSEGTMHGEAIGLTVEGSLDYVHDQVDMSGTFVPVYAFNNLFAKIPLFGVILAGGSNEGLIGVNYRISGLASNPTLSINPLSAIAPGIFRQIFGVTDLDPMRPQ
ncbi:MAG TPA: AsmA-like C-terminal domain-containing protein [Methylocella sp.]|nr:AsmA-like C-terminal domain-containing protein [Methylocella sp.]